MKSVKEEEKNQSGCRDVWKVQQEKDGGEDREKNKYWKALERGGNQDGRMKLLQFF